MYVCMCVCTRARVCMFLHPPRHNFGGLLHSKSQLRGPSACGGYVYVRTHVRTCVRTYICMHVCMHVCMVIMCVRVYVHCVHIYACAHIMHTCMCVRMHMIAWFIHIYMRVWQSIVCGTPNDKNKMQIYPFYLWEPWGPTNNRLPCMKTRYMAFSHLWAARSYWIDGVRAMDFRLTLPQSENRPEAKQLQPNVWLDPKSNPQEVGGVAFTSCSMAQSGRPILIWCKTRTPHQNPPKNRPKNWNHLQSGERCLETKMPGKKSRKKNGWMKDENGKKNSNK